MLLQGDDGVHSLVASHETAGYIYLYGFIIPFYYGNVSRNITASGEEEE